MSCRVNFHANGFGVRLLNSSYQVSKRWPAQGLFRPGGLGPGISGVLSVPGFFGSFSPSRPLLPDFMACSTIWSSNSASSRSASMACAPRPIALPSMPSMCHLCHLCAIYGVVRSERVRGSENPAHPRSRSEPLAARVRADAFPRASECVAVVPVLTAGGQDLGMRDGPGGKERTQPNVAIAPREGLLLVK
jgi:hypothetical protein